MDPRNSIRITGRIPLKAEAFRQEGAMGRVGERGMRRSTVGGSAYEGGNGRVGEGGKEPLT